MSLSEFHGTVWEHFDVFRKAIVKSLTVILLGFLIAFCFYESVFDLLQKPLKISPTKSVTHYEIKTEKITNFQSTSTVFHLTDNMSLRDHSQGVELTGDKTYLIPSQGYIVVEKTLDSHKLVIFNPLEGLILSVKTSFWLGILITAPLWLGFLVEFILPGLHAFEKKLVLPFIVLSFIFMGVGVLIAYSVSLPLANEYLYAFNSGIADNLWSVSQYLSFTLALLLAHAFALEICLILLFVVHFGIVSAETLAFYRRQIIVTAFILGAIMTPPDVLTQLILSTILIGIYEIAIVYAKIKERRVQFLSTRSS